MDSDPIPEGSSIGVSFDLGDLDPEVHNVSTYGHVRVKGLLPLLLPQGQYKPPPFMDDPSRLQKLIEGRYLKEYGCLLPDELDEDIIAKFSDFAKFIAYLNPAEDFESPAMQVNVAFSILTFVNDDMLDELMNGSEFMKYKDLKTALEGFYSHYYRDSSTLTDIPVIIPALQVSQPCIIKFIKEGELTFPKHFESKAGVFNHLMNACRSLCLLSEKHPSGKGLSYGSRIYFGGLSGAGSANLEMNVICRGIQIPKEVREDGVVKKILMASDSATHLLNDVLGLARDMKKNSVNDSNILAMSLERGIPLQQAYDIIYNQLKDELMDMRLLIDRVRGYYAGVEGVDAYLRVVEEFNDGQFHFYKNVGRYGDIGKGMKWVAHDP